MAREIKLNSNDWCDIVFDGKNKKYGAYELRQSSSKRHLIAFGTIVLFVSIVLTLPMLLNAVNPPKDHVVTVMDGPWIVGDLPDEPEPEKEIVEPIVKAPPVKILATQIFTPPVIKPDPDVDESKELEDQKTLYDSKVQISVVTIDGSNDKDAVDISTLTKNEIIVGNTDSNKPKIYEHVAVMPQFMGGDVELMRYLSANIKYPSIAIDNGIEGRVVLKFVVRKDGSIDNINVIRPLDPSCDKEATRVLKAMPRWIPGQQNGIPVDVYFTLPVLFRLQK